MLDGEWPILLGRIYAKILIKFTDHLHTFMNESVYSKGPLEIFIGVKEALDFYG